MLVIREQQLKLLELDRVAQFKRRMLDHLAHAYPDDYAQMGESGARSLLDRAVSFGATRGIRNEMAIAGLLGLFVEFGPTLDLAPYRPWVLSILDHPRLGGHLKVGLIRERLDPITQGRRIVRYQED